MSQNNTEDSSFDKNLRSLLDAISMFEREASTVLDRFGVDTDGVARVMNLLGSVSSEMVRPVAAALGIADVAAVESLARDVRALLQGEARSRRDQAATASRLDDFLSALEALGSTTAGLADLQGRTQDRLDALDDRASAIEARTSQTKDLADEVAKLGTKVQELEALLAAEMGLAPDTLSLVTASDETDSKDAVKPGGTRRPAPRTVRTTTGAHKILEGLPTLEPKIRPA